MLHNTLHVLHFCPIRVESFAPRRHTLRQPKTSAGLLRNEGTLRDVVCRRFRRPRACQGLNSSMP
jgi:hypothetical protein